jgi:HSP20 family protein
VGHHSTGNNLRKEIMMDTMVRENRNGTERRETERFVAPPASLTENADGYLLTIEMPGVSKEGLEIAVENNELTIVGRRSLPAISGTLLHRESRSENFRRAFELDPSIDTAKITAKMEQGIVALNLPKAEQVKPRKITVG